MKWVNVSKELVIWDSRSLKIHTIFTGMICLVAYLWSLHKNIQNMYLTLIWKYIQRNMELGNGSGWWCTLLVTYMIILGVTFMSPYITMLMIWHDHDINSEQSIDHSPWEFSASSTFWLPFLSHIMLVLQEWIIKYF